jgi:hypothetical protein
VGRGVDSKSEKHDEKVKTKNHDLSFGPSGASPTGLPLVGQLSWHAGHGAEARHSQ